MTMIETPSELIGTPPRASAATATTLLSDVLGRIRLTGALFLKGEYSAPWAFDSPGSCVLAELLSPDAERLIVFHVVRQGRVWISAGGHHLEFEAGDLAILPSSHRHVMGSPEFAEPVQIKDLLPQSPWSDIPILRHGGDGELTEMVCGYFRCDELLFNSFLRSLPPVIKIRPVGTAAALLEAALSRALEDGPGCGTAVRLPELLLVEALRLYSSEAPLATGWLAATNDPVVSRALKLMHDDPIRDWTVDELARRAATSRSVLGERFKALLDQSPMRYLAEWRMQLAANLLRTTGLKLASVAERSGYGSEAAFSRAFHRHVGMSPAQWRETSLALATEG
ncbi:MAG: AraC family transcriptional regulator [Devosia nanyangense]|uniref:AraC family transcriptional regulator n=1 Tax=Devosia nanyangense TaxID=1228055 RepID=A0A933L172_9HYPH|nr:AraC family transcriptional regulator [Devosia nanyangense]